VSQQIDIIVPVYNGLEDLKKCVESVKKNTDLSKHRLILVDDKSPDSNVLPYLKSVESEVIHVIESPVNEGFSASVNKGMQYSDRDVILLNSDTIVTKGWVEKIIACAYSKRAAATVTPLSNAATLCSVPEFLQDNTLPCGYDAEKMGALVEHCSIRRYPRVTVAVGFCMFIKREVIEKIGYFDAETFGKGYGEENDFCHRAEQQGYMHLMCDDTFIYHKGTASFDSEEKRKLLEEHERILQERYPAYIKRNGQYCSKNPNRDLQENVKLYLKMDYASCGKLYLTDTLPVESKEEKAFFAVRQERSVQVKAFCGGNEVFFSFPAPELGVQTGLAEEAEEEILKDVMRAFSLGEVIRMAQGNFALQTFKTLQQEAKHLENAFDAKRILRGYLTANEDFMSENELVDGIYGKELRSLKEKYEALQQEDKVRQEELTNIYNSKRFKLACGMEKLIKPLKR
jgi:GT2 family glycosyltransferase